MERLTLATALAENRLEEFIKQREAESLPPADAEEFDEAQFHHRLTSIAG